MRDHWIDGLIAVTTMGSLYWTLMQMARQTTFVITPFSDYDSSLGGETRETEVSTTGAIAPQQIILGSDQPVDEDPDLDLDLDDLGAIATFENQRL
ncbi:MAG: hypothetical protein VKJ64_13005 [Leptolyngbyaceae bacterium]|nr:hypothetical protein [Leptolyngbyaceae bacterium]